MGTNFYAVLPSRSRTDLVNTVNTLNNVLDKDFPNWNEVRLLTERVGYLASNSIPKIHLGKRSGGWIFCWDANECQYYTPLLDSIHNFIVNNKATIINEYDEEFTWEEFINNELKDCLYVNSNPKLYNTHREYHLKNTSTADLYGRTSPRLVKLFEPYSKDGVDAMFQEFISKDNLRFVTYTDFS